MSSGFCRRMSSCCPSRMWRQWSSNRWVKGRTRRCCREKKEFPRSRRFQESYRSSSSGTELLVDGFRGTLVIAPTLTTRTDFQERMEKWRATLVRCKAACREPARTLDGQLVSVEANIGIHDDAELALDNGADGVGLLRIEQLYFARPMPPTEDELFRAARKPDPTAGQSAGDHSPSRHRRRQAAALFGLAPHVQSRVGTPRRAIAAGLRAAGQNANGSDLETFPGAFAARADSDGHAGRRYSPDAGGVRCDDAGSERSPSRPSLARWSRHRRPRWRLPRC